MRQVEFERALTRRVDRRRLIAGTGAGLGIVLSAANFPTRLVEARQATPAATPTLGGSPFSLGVASGDPLPDTATTQDAPISTISSFVLESGNPGIQTA